MDAVTEKVSEQLEREVDLLCQEAKAIGAAIGVVRDGELVWTHGYGFKDLEGDDAPAPSTLFRIASITKSFTATAIFMLQERGLLNIDDALATHIPEFANAIPRKGPLEDVTLRRMMCHRSGLMNYAPTGENSWNTGTWSSMQEILDAFPQTEVSIEPDSAFKYNNLAYGLLGEVVTRVSGRPYEEFVTSEILEPLGLTSTTFEPNAELMARTAIGYMPMPYEEAPVIAPHQSLGGQIAAGQLYSTVEDLARWIKFHLGPPEDAEEDSPILSAAGRKEMQRPLYMQEDWSMGFGMPWWIWRQNDDTVRGHGGGIQGYSTQISFIATRRMGVIMLFNGPVTSQPIQAKIFEIVSEAEDAFDALKPGKKPTATPPELQEYLGLYHGAFETTLKFEYRDDSLQMGFLDTPSPPPVALEPTDDPDVFRATSQRPAGDRVSFTRTASGVIRSVIVEAGEYWKLTAAGE